MRPVCTSVLFAVPGDPQPWKRAGSNGTRRYTPEVMKVAEHEVATRFRQASRGWGQPIGDPVEFGLELTFRCKTNVGKDADNLAKLVMDALQGVAYVNDKQVTQLRVDIERNVGRLAETICRVYARPLA